MKGDRQTMNEEQVLTLVRAKLEEIKVEGAEQATMDTTWEELDVDSLDLVELVQSLEDEYGIRIDDEQLKPVKTVGDAVRLVISVKEGAGSTA
jgi:acyl carrier protein